MILKFYKRNPIGIILNKRLLPLYLICLLISCSEKTKKNLFIKELPLTTQHSGESNLFVNEEGTAHLSWIEYLNDTTDVLKVATLSEKSEWSDIREIAQGSNWFVNWADFPALVQFGKNKMMVHWLQKSAKGTYDYDIRMSISNDNGQTWSSSFIPHKDGINAEHGFLSMVPTNDERVFATWLDGRNTKKETNNAMTLRSAIIDTLGNLYDETELDNRVCDCCQTSATWTDVGPIVVYRDRTNEEIRDISIVRKINDKWSDPKPLNKDNWKIAGCPVNGPSIDSEDKNVVVTWFTSDKEIPKVWAVFSNDSGSTFSDPIRIDEGQPLGRVDVEIWNGNAYIIWMEDKEEHAEIKMRVLDVQQNLSEAHTLGHNSNSRKSGFPRMAIDKKGILVSWTAVQEDKSEIKTFRVHID